MDERRSSTRWQTALKGRILFNNRSSVLNCTIRDLSETGAHIYFADVSVIPSEFELEIPTRGVRIRGRRMWSRGANHGVMFYETFKVWPDLMRAAAA